MGSPIVVATCMNCGRITQTIDNICKNCFDTDKESCVIKLDKPINTHFRDENSAINSVITGKLIIKPSNDPVMDAFLDY